MRPDPRFDKYDGGYKGISTMAPKPPAKKPKPDQGNGCGWFIIWLMLPILFFATLWCIL